MIQIRQPVIDTAYNNLTEHASESAHIAPGQSEAAVQQLVNDRSIDMNETTQKLARDVDSVAADARELIVTGAERVADGVTSAREKTRATIAEVQTKISGAKQAAVDKMHEGARAADDYVHASPWASIGAAALIGAVIGFILGRR